MEEHRITDNVAADGNIQVQEQPNLECVVLSCSAL